MGDRNHGIVMSAFGRKRSLGIRECLIGCRLIWFTNFVHAIGLVSSIIDWLQNTILKGDAYVQPGSVKVKP